MNAAASAGSSCAISSSIFAQIGTARVAAPDRNASSPASCTASSALRQIRFVEVEHEQQRLRRQELKSAQPLRIVAGELERAQRRALPRARRGSGRRISCSLLELGRVALLEIPLEPLEPPFDDAEVREDELVLHRPHVARRIDRAGRMRHRRDRETSARRAAARRRCGTARRRAAPARRSARRRRRRCRRTPPSPARACAG